MSRRSLIWTRLAIASALSVCCLPVQAQQKPSHRLIGTSWQLLKIQGRDGKVVSVADSSKYKLDFYASGRLAVRVDCNGGRGRWTSSKPGHLEFTPLALTKVACGPGSLHDRIVKDWTTIRSYAIKGNQLILSIPNAGGSYEFVPAAGSPDGPVTTAVAMTGPRTYDCTRPGGSSERIRATLYQTQPAMVLVERGGQSRPAFLVPSPSGARYQAAGLAFWDNGADVTVVWSDVSLSCKRQ